MAEITVLTTSYNKTKQIAELKAALEKQTILPEKFIWHILDNSTYPETRDQVLSWQSDQIKVTTHDFSPEQRRRNFVHPVLLNLALPDIDTKYFIHISDDDLPEPSFLETLLGFLRYNADKMACYVPMRQLWCGKDETHEHIGQIPSALVTFSGTVNPIGNLDGNCVLIQTKPMQELKEYLNKIGLEVWPEDWNVASGCDGHMLLQFCLVLNERIWPASSEPLMNHRITELSTFINSRFGQRIEYRADPLCEEIFSR